MGDSTKYGHSHDVATLLKHYNRPEILSEIIRNSVNKEVVGSFGGTGYAKRPDVLEYPQDVLELVKRGVTSFHASEELWSNALLIHPDMQKQDVKKLRVGWDLILDIDCKILDYSKIGAHRIIQTLKQCGISNISCKFSGNHGFHIAVPFESFSPTIRGISTKDLFPELPRAIAEYLKIILREQLSADLIAFEKEKNPKLNDRALVTLIAENAQIPVSKIFISSQNSSGDVFEKFDPFSIVGIDTVLITSRHLYRQVYSVNEKSGLISLPINPDKVLQFDKKIASIENHLVSRFQFLDRDKSVCGEAADFLIQAYDFSSKKKQEADSIERMNESAKKEKSAAYVDLTEKIPFDFFPPHIHAMLAPLQDGKKRALFVLLNFLRCCNYTNEEIDVIINEWNAKHIEPLRQAYLKGQLRHFKQQTEKILPPNFDSSVYTDIIKVERDALSLRVKNPVSYAKARMRTYMMLKKEEKKEKKPKEPKKKIEKTKVVEEKAGKTEISVPEEKK